MLNGLLTSSAPTSKEGKMEEQETAVSLPLEHNAHAL